MNNFVFGKSVKASIGKRNPSKPNHWEPLSLEKYRITKPTVICLGGNSTKDFRAANAMCRIAANLIGIKEQVEDELATYNDVDIIGVAYGCVENPENNPSSTLTKEEIDYLVDTLLLPLAVDENGNKYSFEQAQKNFSNVTFFSHCYGAKVINELNMNLISKMIAAKYNLKDILELEKQIISVSYAPAEEVFNFPSLQILPQKDSTTRLPYNINKNFEIICDKVYQSQIDFDKNYVFKENVNTVTLFSSALSKINTDEHSIIFIDRSADWSYNISNAQHGDIVSQVTGYTLANAVATSVNNYYSDKFTPKPTPEQILQASINILGDAQQDLGYHGQTL